MLPSWLKNLREPSPMVDQKVQYKKENNKSLWLLLGFY